MPEQMLRRVRVGAFRSGQHAALSVIDLTASAAEYAWIADGAEALGRSGGVVPTPLATGAAAPPSASRRTSACLASAAPSTRTGAESGGVPRSHDFRAGPLPAVSDAAGNPRGAHRYSLPEDGAARPAKASAGRAAPSSTG